MRIEMTWPAAPDAFIRTIGSRTTVKVLDVEREGTVTAVQVSTDGKSAKVIVDVDDPRISEINARLAGERSGG